ncbi:terminase small subunit [Frigoriglobus tundricola]|uniref:Terminase small subunit n=1 Tax=Frigoriglobus tundricola TaxID=2774151 RepID=A0A6M5Z584_9BACT|nr:terminase small subunit [Frigoriglobus tundricola]QJX01246.1 hypothetical protein FTUN_8885 [Frigoriglobus tundricola]
MSRPLNPKQLKFVDRYLATGNATQSYIDAGYAGRGRAAENAASRLLGSVGVKAAIDGARAKALKTHEVTAEWVVTGLKKEAEREGEGASHAARVQAYKLLGTTVGLFDEKHVHEHSGPGGSAIPLNLTTLSDDELRALDGLLARAALPPAPAHLGDPGAGPGGTGPTEPE